MSGQSDNTHIQSKISASKLGPNAAFLSPLQHLFFEIDISKSPAVLIARSREFVQILRRCHLNGFQASLRGGSPNHENEVIWRTSGCSKRDHLLQEKCFQGFRVKQRLGLLIQKGLVCRATPFAKQRNLNSVPPSA